LLGRKSGWGKLKGFPGQHTSYYSYATAEQYVGPVQ
jgi:hypothetical protein